MCGARKRLLEDAAGVPVVGYRAPSYSITRRSLWALDVLIEEGYRYDSSIFPIRHDRYGIPVSPRTRTRIVRRARARSSRSPVDGSVGPVNLPVAGGGYFRILPYTVDEVGHFARQPEEGQPAVFYLHPWEIDPEQPRLRPGWLGRFRHYRNLGATETRLRRLMQDFAFDTIQTMLANLPEADALAAVALSVPYPG